MSEKCRGQVCLEELSQLQKDLEDGKIAIPLHKILSIFLKRIQMLEMEVGILSASLKYCGKSLSELKYEDED